MTKTKRVLCDADTAASFFSLFMLMLNLKFSFQSLLFFGYASGFDLILLFCPAQSSVM